MYQYKVKLDRVVDGDTIDVWIDLGFSIQTHQRLRLLGINAPETRTKDLNEKARGMEAKEWLTEKLTNLKGKEIVIETRKAGKYGRYLATVFLIDPETKTKIININKLMLDLGLAEEYGK